MTDQVRVIFKTPDRGDIQFTVGRGLSETINKLHQLAKRTGNTQPLPMDLPSEIAGFEIKPDYEIEISEIEEME